MDKLVRNLKIYEILKKLGKLKDEPKVEKNLVFKASNKTFCTKDKETAYTAKRVIKALEKYGVSRKGKSSRYITDRKVNDTCHKCGNPGHYIRDCLMHGIEFKEYAKKNGKKKRGRKQV